MPPIIWVTDIGRTNPARAASAQPRLQKPKLLCNEAADIFHRLSLANPPTVEDAEALLAQELDLHHVNKHAEILEALEKLCASSHLIHEAVKKNPTHQRRKQSLMQLQELWGPNFIPDKYKPKSISNDLLRELLGICKEVVDRTELARLWDDDGVLPQLMRNQPVSHRRPYITPKIVKMAREALKVKEGPKVTIRRKRPFRDKGYQPPLKRPKTYDPDASIERMRDCGKSDRDLSDHDPSNHDGTEDDFPEGLDASPEPTSFFNDPMPEQPHKGSNSDGLQPHHPSNQPIASSRTRQAFRTRQLPQTPEHSQHSLFQNNGHSPPISNHSHELATPSPPSSPNGEENEDLNKGGDSEHLDVRSWSRSNGSCLSWDGSSDSRSVLPTTDEVGAIKSLQPTCLLSATAIQLVLDEIFPTDPERAFRTVDSTYVNIYDVASIQQKTRLRIEPTCRHLLVLLHSKNDHWTFADINLGSQMIWFYNTDASKQLESLTKAALLRFASHHQAGLESSLWNFQVAPCIQQTNSYDCGVLMLVNIIRLVVTSFETPNPKQLVNCDLWRVLFESLIRHVIIEANISPGTSITTQPSGRQLTPEQIQMLETAVDQDKDSMDQAEFVVDGVIPVLELLDLALKYNEKITGLFLERMTAMETERQQSDILFEQLLAKCKTMYNKEELEPLRQRAEGKLHPERKRWEDIIAKYKQGAESLRLTIATACNVRDAHERRRRESEQNRRQAIQTLSEHWRAQERLVNEQADRWKRLLPAENT
ncbi:MAG: hypothetical protein Q9219_004789 [cf. Caloplaca sp. 3 TL-2023]